MTTQRMFGRRMRNEATHPRAFVRRDDGQEEPRPERKKMTGGQIAIAVIGILAGISILNHSNQDGQKAAALATKPTAVVAQKAPAKKCGATLREYEALQIGIT